MMMWSLSARRAGSRTDSIGRLGTDWTNFSVQLSASANWRWNWNQPATQEQMHQVLAAPTRLEIRGEFRTGDDTGGLDNIQLIAQYREAADWPHWLAAR
jgi:hypothetical protein